MATTSDAHPLWRELDVDVPALGAGVTGLTTALLLKRDGARVAVVEAARVGGGATAVLEGAAVKPLGRLGMK